MLYAIVAILIIIIDQAVKLGVTNMVLDGTAVKTLIPGVLSLVRVQNDGAAFSFLAGGGARIWFIILTLIFVALVIVALVTNFISGKFGRWCMVVVAAGGLSNCIDRVLYGYVLDMFRIDLFNFAVFNVADIFITVGCIAFIIYILFGGEKNAQPEDQYEEEDNEEADTPVREPLFKKRKPAYEEDDEDDDDEDEDEEEAKPAKKVAVGALLGRKAKAADSDVSAKATVKKSPKGADAILERARSAKKAEDESASSKRRSAEDEAKEFEKFFKNRAASKKVAEQSAPKTTPVKIEARAEETESPKEGPVVKTAPAVEKKEPPVAEKPKASSTSTDDFDLDSILNEFK